ncbi:hypothetical protein [Methylocystis parvus]|uniref:Nucleoside 2-deoxyribosyltransferase n=1 Tax=Methylocystis parvus TaxID=134 RepID=A0A6B8M7W4_9HYPH|nr:hypothetical protein [Methylocystis parvus]QGM97709.1 hypothetical protein F7D14_09675 [Methylocystis parvus]WBJ98355.1 nucleoside 2-deoxyribosyltransferase [Methylocystis parvus OBBP]
MAGKIAQHGWRERLAHETVIVSDSLDPHETQDFPDFTLTGPFFVACGHGCAHGPATHGQGCFERGDGARRRVFDANIARIEHSDFIFAHVNELDCFGTLFEIGHAHACGVPVFLNFGPDLTDRQKQELWFARMGCTMVLGPLEEAFECALQIWGDACVANVFGEVRHG